MMKEKRELLEKVRYYISRFEKCNSFDEVSALYDRIAKALAEGYLDDVIGSKTYDLWLSRAYRDYLAYAFIAVNNGGENK